MRTGPEGNAVGIAAPLRRRIVLADDVYEAVKRLIIEHAIGPGARISIEGLARDLGVSPTPVREALARLESTGLLVKEALRGYMAAPPLDRAQFEDLFDFRLLLEPWAAARATALVGAEDIQALRAELASPLLDFQALTAHDARFHALVADLSGSAQVRSALERTHTHLHIFRLTPARDAGTVTLEEHGAVAEAIAGGDPAAAERAMRHHLLASRGRLRPVFG